MVVPRVIVSLVLVDHYFYTTYKYRKFTYLGDPVNIIKILNEKKIDELAIIAPYAYRTGIDYEYLSLLNRYANMPVSYTGGIRQLSDARRILKSGYEKVGVNTLFYERPEIVADLVDSFGSSSVIGVLDLKQNLFGSYKKYVHITKKVKDFRTSDIKELVDKSKVGELVVNNVTRNGTWKGLDFELHNSLDAQLGIPVIHSGGIGSTEEFFAPNSHGLSLMAGNVFSFQKNGFGVMFNYPTERVLNNRRLFAMNAAKRIIEELGHLNEE